MRLLFKCLRNLTIEIQRTFINSSGFLQENRGLFFPKHENSNLPLPSAASTRSSLSSLTPSSYPGSTSKDDNDNSFNASLHLCFVHGYQGGPSRKKDRYYSCFQGYDSCRDNLFYTNKGEIIYHIAGIAVLYTRSTHSQRFYFGHSEDILSLTLHPSGEIAATGDVGKKPTIKVWSLYPEIRTLTTLSGIHERGVCCVDFSGDGRFLASVGVDDFHTLIVWDWEKGEPLSSSRCHVNKVFGLKFNPHDSTNLVTIGQKLVKFWRRDERRLSGRRGALGSLSNAWEDMECLAFGRNAKICYTGSSSGSVYVWNGTSLHKRIQGVHKGPCFALDFDDDVVVTGGADGVVAFWDETLTKAFKVARLNNENITPDSHGFLSFELPPVNALDIRGGRCTLIGTKNGEVLEMTSQGIRVLVQGHNDGELWGLATHPSAPIFATAGEDKTLRIWDERSNEMTRFKRLESRARCCDFFPDGSAVVVGCVDGLVRIIDAETMEEINAFRDRRSVISDVRFSPDGSQLAVASHEATVDVYCVFSSQRICVCDDASGAVRHLDWDLRGEMLHVETAAREELIYETRTGRRCVVGRWDLPRLSWATMTGILGADMTGVRPLGTNLTGVLAADRSRSGGLAASADDEGRVTLYRYPVKSRKTPHHHYHGHSSHVTNVRWSHDDAFLVSVGGRDTSVFVWELRR